MFVLLAVSPLFLNTIMGSAYVEAWSFVTLIPLAVFGITRLRSEYLSVFEFILVLWLAYVFLFGLIGEYPFLSVVESLRLASMLCVLILARLSLRLIGKRVIIGIIAVSGFLPSLFGFYLLLGAGGVSQEYSGMTGTFGLHNPFAGFLLMTIPMAIYMVYETWGIERYRLLWIIVSIVQIAAFILARSRASLAVALVVILLLTTLLLIKKHGALRARGIRIIGYSLVASGVVFVAIVPLVLTRHLSSLYEALDYSLRGRMAFWEGGISAFLDNVLIGTGVNTFANTFTRYQDSFKYYSTDPHSFVVSTLQGQGIIGFCFLIITLAAIVNAVAKKLAADNAIETLSIATGICGCALHSSVDFDLTFTANAWVFMTLLALAFRTESWVSGSREYEGAPMPVNYLRLYVKPFALIVLLAVWFVGIVIANAAWLNVEARAGDRASVSDSAYNAVFPYVPFFMRKYSEINSANFSASERLSALKDLNEKLTRFNDANSTVASSRYLEALTSDALRLSKTKELLLEAINLDSNNHPEYYFVLSSYLEKKKDYENVYEVLTNFLTKSIPLSEPIKPDHYRPTWITMNKEFARSWRRLSELEASFGSTKKASEYRDIAERFENYSYDLSIE